MVTQSTQGRGKMGGRLWREGEAEPERPAAPAHHPGPQKAPNREGQILSMHTTPSTRDAHRGERRMRSRQKVAGGEGGVRKRGDTRGEEQDGGTQEPPTACASREICHSRAAGLGFYYCFLKET